MLIRLPSILENSVIKRKYSELCPLRRIEVQSIQLILRMGKLVPLVR
jgi:hypothetical protein